MRRRPGSEGFNEWLRVRCETEDAIERAEDARRQAREAAAANASWAPPDEDDLHPIDPKVVRY